MEQKSPNYMTPSGYARLQSEFEQLKRRERPKVVEVVAWAASNGDRSENADYQYGKKRLREIDRRLRYLQQQIDSAVVIDPSTIKSSIVQFGATVRLEDDSGATKVYTIVGSEESDPAEGKISHLSPLARALINARARVGDLVSYSSPQGEKDIEVMALEYTSE